MKAECIGHFSVTEIIPFTHDTKGKRKFVVVSIYDWWALRQRHRAERCGKAQLLRTIVGRGEEETPETALKTPAA